ncbi:MAG: CBS domain-containing protein [Anaerolineales bacterium]|nr:CBS domain-containing protein [Anaerolineales bacterium]
MRIILTHEQADFDALASLLGAYLVDDSSQPVLPRRMNRNVRAFITLYGAELPFVDPRDLPGEPIDMVTLVDTQNMATLKGMSQETRVQAIDHHPLRTDTPEGWTISTVEIGATATLFVEQLREHNGSLSMIYATLLLLGIYEDTGSLTYSRTTARDLRAASYLLEQGANLRIAVDFLNHPLSLQQQALYDTLREQSQVLNVHGYTIILAWGKALDMDEELSSIAHKLRDLLDPDALILLIATRGGVQMICRSTSDHIDVAEIAKFFGGGGHARAAAGLIKDRSIEDVCSELTEILPDKIRPAVTVAEIMSHGLQVLTPETPVQEAATRMQRYGYEGYPVVEDGRVVGLLTRRAVDRALSHKLNLTAASLMNAGNVSVKSNDSISYLQHMMTETGWGQIPVTHPESSEIIGIVTRTDLLKTLTKQHGQVGLINLAERLERALPPARLALLKQVAELAHSLHSALYIVGGFVRDLILEHPSLDFDLVVEGDAIALAQRLRRRFGGRLTTHGRFGTAKWIIAEQRSDLATQLGYRGQLEELPEYLDLITARTEFYTYPTALPTVERSSIKLDLHRRDFTINTLALRLDGHHYGELHDHWGGFNDLRSGQVRVLHSLSFVDDPTRILRAVRFEQRFAFEIEPRTLDLLREAVTLLLRVSGDRLRHELEHILEEERRLEMLDRLHELRVLEALHPALQWDDWLRHRIGKLSDHNNHGLDLLAPLFNTSPKVSKRILLRRLATCLWLMRLTLDRQQAVLGRLKIPVNQAREIRAAARLWRDLPSLGQAIPSVVVSRLEDIPSLAIYANCLATEDSLLCQVLRNYIERWRFVSSHTTGDDLRARGLPPGPAYREILTALRNAWLDDKIHTMKEEQEMLAGLIRETGEKKADS